jgi:hypothetical protein
MNLMKRSALAFLAALLVLPSLPAAAEDREPAAALFLQPLGLLQFGPMAEVEFRLAPALSMSAHVRAQGLGLLSHLLVTEAVEYWGMAAGVGMRYFIYPGAGPNAWFVGGMADIGLLGFSGDAGLATAYHGISLFTVFAANAGFRWRFGAFILELGVYAGVGPTIFSNYQVDANPGITYDAATPFTFFGMGELSLGIAL